MDAIDCVFPPREQVTLDFTACSSIGALYLEMRTKMAWDDAYGENLDALWDILTGLPYRGDDFTIFLPRTYPSAGPGSSAGLAEYVDRIISLFREGEAEQYLSVKVAYSDDLPE